MLNKNNELKQQQLLQEQVINKTKVLNQLIESAKSNDIEKLIKEIIKEEKNHWLGSLNLQNFLEEEKSDNQPDIIVKNFVLKN